jgi:hypothetical protein
MLSPGRRPARAAAGLCPDVYLGCWYVLHCRSDRPKTVVEKGFVIKGSESVCVQEKRRVKARSS